MTEKKNKNWKKEQVLGMPLGTAMGRLRKNVLFYLLQRHNEHICYKCSKPIETADELTIEHKIPWLDGGTELFWDISNIAFSHAICNRPRKLLGEKVGTSKLKEEDIPKIRKLYKDGISKRGIARMFSVEPKTIRSLLSGETWIHIK